MNLNNFWLGATLGIIAPVVSLFGFYAYQFDSISMNEFFRFLNDMGVTMQVLSFCSMPSFLLFFIFYYAHYNRSAQGVVGSTMIITIGLVILNSLGF